MWRGRLGRRRKSSSRKTPDLPSVLQVALEGAENRLRVSPWPCGEPREVAVHPVDELDLVYRGLDGGLVVPVLQKGGEGSG
jgi:hypothetical protein